MKRRGGQNAEQLEQREDKKARRRGCSKRNIFFIHKNAPHKERHINREEKRAQNNNNNNNIKKKRKE